ncbi:leucine-rich repeat and coiled-coil domain-containing protein PF3D7_0703800-like isoform X2 [Physella acuta]|uniref:leucine-rich repeat and coiled-coil domain-containing protein PF3D7_0703800-like isoform X2 n=1 Tax=Physella acuta TaxID=109671 RepID=UPI0027DE1A68|nr:leucine-rich repeat and coiled-coil domain-containing protein PF3D7_0703800-like isoform X2 [Physella acuta]
MESQDRKMKKPTSFKKVFAAPLKMVGTDQAEPQINKKITSKKSKTEIDSAGKSDSNAASESSKQTKKRKLLNKESSESIPPLKEKKQKQSEKNKSNESIENDHDLKSTLPKTTTGKKKKVVNPPRSLTEHEYDELFKSVLNTIVDKDECDHFTTKSEDKDNSTKIDKLLNVGNKDPADDFSDAESLSSNGIDCWDDEIPKRTKKTESPDSEEEKDNVIPCKPKFEIPKKCVKRDKDEVHPREKLKKKQHVTVQNTTQVLNENKEDKTTTKMERKSKKKKLNITMKEATQAIIENDEDEEKGTWVQCCNASCSKWRYLDYIEDPLLVPENWECHMNSDEKYNSCEKPEVNYDESEHILTKYTLGSIVWAKMDGYPWWPAIVENDPDYDIYFEVVNETSLIPTQYHVTFFGERVTRAWVKVRWIIPYIKNVLPKAQLSSSHHAYKKDFQLAINSADTAIELSLQERLKKFSFTKNFKKKFRNKYCESHTEEKPRVFQSRKKKLESNCVKPKESCEPNDETENNRNSDLEETFSDDSLEMTSSKDEDADVVKNIVEHIVDQVCQDKTEEVEAQTSNKVENDGKKTEGKIVKGTKRSITKEKVKKIKEKVFSKGSNEDTKDILKEDSKQVSGNVEPSEVDKVTSETKSLILNQENKEVKKRMKKSTFKSVIAKPNSTSSVENKSEKIRRKLDSSDIVTLKVKSDEKSEVTDSLEAECVSKMKTGNITMSKTSALKKVSKKESKTIQKGTDEQSTSKPKKITPIKIKNKKDNIETQKATDYESTDKPEKKEPIEIANNLDTKNCSDDSELLKAELPLTKKKKIKNVLPVKNVSKSLKSVESHLKDKDSNLNIKTSILKEMEINKVENSDLTEVTNSDTSNVECTKAKVKKLKTKKEIFKPSNKPTNEIKEKECKYIKIKPNVEMKESKPTSDDQISESNKKQNKLKCKKKKLVVPLLQNVKKNDDSIKQGKDREVPVYITDNEIEDHDSNKENIENDQHIVPDISSTPIEECDTELEERRFEDLELKLKNKEDEEELELNLNALNTQPTNSQKTVDKIASDEEDSDYFFNLDIDNKETVTADDGYDMSVHGKFGGRCNDHGWDSDPLEIIED